jgi:hypothetical protein
MRLVLGQSREERTHRCLTRVTLLLQADSCPPRGGRITGRACQMTLTRPWMSGCFALGLRVPSLRTGQSRQLDYATLAIYDCKPPFHLGYFARLSVARLLHIGSATGEMRDVMGVGAQRDRCRGDWGTILTIFSPDGPAASRRRAPPRTFRATKRTCDGGTCTHGGAAFRAGHSSDQRGSCAGTGAASGR